MLTQRILRGTDRPGHLLVWSVLSCCLLGLSSLSASWAQAGATDGADESACAEGAGLNAARRVQARYDQIRDLQAEFEQQTQSAVSQSQPDDATPQTEQDTLY